MVKRPWQLLMKRQTRIRVLYFLFDLNPKSVIICTLLYFATHTFICRTLLHFLVNIANVRDIFVVILMPIVYIVRVHLHE